MPFFRNVLSDLVEKRLWPVAIALVAALVAVPIVLGGGSSGSGSSTPSTIADASATNDLANSRDAARAHVVSLEEQAAGKVTRGGKVRDIFIQHHQPKVVATTSETSTATSTTKTSASGGSSGGATTTSGGSTGGATSTPVTKTPTTTGGSTPTTTPKPADKDTYQVNLSFGESGAEKTYNNVARLTPLPSSDNPFFVFLGLAADKKSAVFLINAQAVPNGDGHCTPSQSDCEQISLKATDEEFFDLQSGTGGVVQYDLTVKSIHKATAASIAKAAKAHARESKAGRGLLRQLVSDDPSLLAAWNYNKSLGLLIRKDPVTDPDVSNVPATVAQGAAGQAVQQTSTVLTVPGS